MGAMMSKPKTVVVWVGRYSEDTVLSFQDGRHRHFGDFIVRPDDADSVAGFPFPEMKSGRNRYVVQILRVGVDEKLPLDLSTVFERA